MNKFIATSVATLLVGATLTSPAFAQSSSSASGNTAASVDLVCMSAAIETRENAVISARTIFHASIMAALNARLTSLKAAFTIANNDDRQAAIKASWDAFMKATVDARAKYRTDVQAAWKVFVEASVKCNIAPDRGPKNQEKQHRNDEDHEVKRENRGLHLGWFKKMIKRTMHDRPGINVEAEAKAGANIDLSF